MEKKKKECFVRRPSNVRMYGLRGCRCRTTVRRKRKEGDFKSVCAGKRRTDIKRQFLRNSVLGRRSSGIFLKKRRIWRTISGWIPRFSHRTTLQVWMEYVQSSESVSWFQVLRMTAVYQGAFCILHSVADYGVARREETRSEIVLAPLLGIDRRLRTT